MTRSELIRKIASRYPNMFLKDVSSIVDVVFEEMSTALAGGRRVELRGFGAFSVRARAPRSARNPKTNEIVDLDERKTAYFRSGKELNELLN